MSRYSDDPRIQDIMALARDRAYWMNMRLRNTARLCADIRRSLQPTRGQEDSWDETVKATALTIAQEAVARERRTLENEARVLSGKNPLRMPESSGHPLANATRVVLTAHSLAQWELEEDAILARMTEIAGTLEIASWVQQPERKGFSLAGLAVIIGHAGHPLDYPKKGHLWKRLGLAPYQKGNVTRAGSSWGYYGGLNDEDWTALGYKRSRLGDIFGKITQPLLYAQWRSTGAIGPYGETYGRYKAAQIERNDAGAFADEAARQIVAIKKRGGKAPKALAEGKLTPAQINRRALRVMTKKLISDLWSEWRRAKDTLLTGAVVAAPADESTNERKAVQSLPTGAVNRVPTAHLNESKANVVLPQAEATATVPTAHLNGRKAKTKVRDTLAGWALPTVQPNEPEAMALAPQSEADDRVPTAQPNGQKAEIKVRGDLATRRVLTAQPKERKAIQRLSRKRTNPSVPTARPNDAGGP